METLETMAVRGCNFCGAFGKVEYIEIAEKEEGYFVYCKFCSSQGPIANTVKGAVLKWNRREKTNAI